MADAQNTVKIIFKGEGDLLKQVKALDEATKSLINAQAKLVKQGKLVKSDSEKNAVAIRKLRVKLLALGSDFDKAGISQSTLTRAMKGSQVAMEQLRNATKKFISTQGQATIAVEKTSKGLFGLGHSARNGTAQLSGMGGAFSVLRSKLLLFNFGMGLGIRQIGKLVAEASKVEAMKTAFATLSGASDGLTISLKKITEATNGTMSEFDLFQQANNAMILGVTKNSDEMAEMFDVAQRLGKALGKDTAQSVESLVTGIGRQSRLMLDNIGIIVKSEEAYEKYAEKLNKSTEDLTDAEKKQAFLEATMEAAREKVKQLGDEALTTSDYLNQFTASSKNLSVAVGELLSPAFGELAKESTTVLKNLIELAKIMGHTKSENLDYYETLERTPNIIKKYSKEHNIAVDSTKSLEYQLQQLMEALSEDVSEENMFAGTKTRNALARTEEAFENLTKATKDFYDSALPEGERPLVDWGLGGLDKSIEAFKDLAKEADDFFDPLINIDWDSMSFPDLDKMLAEQDAEFEFWEKERVATAKKVAEELKQVEQSLLDTKTMMNNAYYEGLKMAQKAALKELTDMQNEMQMENQEYLTNINNSLNAFDGVMSAWKTHMKSRLDEELSTLKDSEVYREADTEKRKDLEREVTKGYEKEQTAQFRIGQATALADIAMSTSSAVMKSVAGSWVTLGQPWFGLITALGAIQAGLVLSQKPPSFESGGMVGGQRHSQGGTMIEAEQGEFVMSRNAVQAIGVETLNQMNQGGGAGLTVNVSAPLVDETVLDTIIPAIQKAQRMNLA